MSRLDWLLGGLLFVVLLIVVVSGLFFWQQSQLALALTPVAGQGITAVAPTTTLPNEPALISFGRAQGRVRNGWQQDAALVTASATWPLVNSADELRDGEANWNFIFYSPSESTAVAANVGNQQVSVSDPYPIYQKLDPLEVSGWQIDSHEALVVFLLHGGNQFLDQQEDVTVTSQLDAYSDNSRMVWLVSAFANRNGNTLTLVIDATSGDVIEVR
jgi:hypothetical protein